MAKQTVQHDKHSRTGGFDGFRAAARFVCRTPVFGGFLSGKRLADLCHRGWGGYHKRILSEQVCRGALSRDRGFCGVRFRRERGVYGWREQIRGFRGLCGFVVFRHVFFRIYPRRQGGFQIFNRQHRRQREFRPQGLPGPRSCRKDCHIA